MTGRSAGDRASIVSFTVLSGALLLALAFGGGTRQGFLGDVYAQFLAIPVLATALFQSPSALDRKIVGGLLLLAAVLLAFLIELPDTIIQALQFSPSALASLGLLVDPHDDRTLSIAPQASWAASVSLIPPIAIFLAVKRLPMRRRLQLAATIVGFGFVSAVLGFAQVAQGATSTLRFFEITNPSEAVGLFANRNHLAALLYTTLLLVCPWLLLQINAAMRKDGLQTISIIGLVGVLALLLLVVAALVLARSRAGILLTMGALVGIALIAMLTRAQNGRPGLAEGIASSRNAVIAVLGFSLLFALQFGFYRIQSRLNQDPLEDLRVVFNTTTLEAIWLNLPFGTGLGSFVPVYGFYEKQADLFTGFANRAHNDIAEFALEAGWIAIACMVFSFAWIAFRSYQIWRRPSLDLSHAGLILQRACTIAIVLLLLHSLVDYPLRTTALSCVFAFCCAAISRPPDEKARTTAEASSTASAPQPKPSTPRVASNTEAQPPKILGKLDNVDWPSEWRSDQ